MRPLLVSTFWGYLALLLCIYSSSGPVAVAQTPSEADLEAVRNTALALPRAIDYADWDGFIALLAEDAVMYFPFAPQRATSRHEIEAVMKPIFMRNQQREPKPIFNFEPVDVQVQMLGDRSAVVAWNMDRPADIARRTAVLRKEGDIWLLAAIHADNWKKPSDNQRLP